MKTTLFAIAFAVTVPVATGLWAEEAETSNQQTATPPAGRGQERLVERFDANGDGRLSETELETARTEMDRRRGGRRGEGGAAGRMGGGRQMMARFDADGDGKLSETERAEARKFRAEMMSRHDADGDGKLSREEMRAARQRMGMPADKPAGRGPQNGADVLRSEKRVDGQPKGRPNREAMIERFDADGDGELAPEELDQARAEMARRRAQQTTETDNQE